MLHEEIKEEAAAPMGHLGGDDRENEDPEEEEEVFYTAVGTFTALEGMETNRKEEFLTPDLFDN